MTIELTWWRMVWLTVVIAAASSAIASLANEDLNTWGANLFTGLGVCFVAGVMTTRTVRAAGWSPRVFLFTWWMWMIGLRFLLLAWQTSELAPPPDWLVVAARTIVATATCVLLVVLATRPQPPDEVDNLVSRSLLLDGQKGSQWR